MASPDRDSSDTAPPPEQLFEDRFLSGPVTPVDVVYGGVSHVGNVRTFNEDHFVVMRRIRYREVLLTNAPLDDLTAPADDAWVFVVADGMGGAGCGSTASRLALQAGIEWGSRSTRWLMKMNRFESDAIDELAQSYARFIENSIRQRVREDPLLAGMGTTLTVAYSMGTAAVIGHIGDSRGYLVRDGALQRLTRDHTVAQELTDAGYPAASVQGFRHLLTNCLGAEGKDVRVEVSQFDLVDGDGLLLCTDGLVEALSEAEIAGIIAAHPAPQDACRSLVTAALQTPAQDNLTAVLARYRVPAE